MRSLVLGEMSGASRSALDTVITETPASLAMSFNLTMALGVRSGPSQLLSQRLEKRTAR